MSEAGRESGVRVDHGYYLPFEGDSGEVHLPLVFVGVAEIGRSSGLRLQGIPRAQPGWSPASLTEGARVYDEATHTLWERRDQSGGRAASSRSG